MIVKDLFDKYTFEEVSKKLLEKDIDVKERKGLYEKIFNDIKNTNTSHFPNEDNILVARYNYDGILSINLYYKENFDIDIHEVSYEEFLNYIKENATPNAFFEYTPFSDLLRVRILESSFSIVDELEFLSIVLKRIVKVYV